MSTRTIPTVTVEPASEVVLEKAGIDSQLTLSLGIVNNTGRELTVVTRNGLKYTLPTRRNMTDRAVYFREGFEASSDTKVDLNPTDTPFDDKQTTAIRLYNNIRNRMTSTSHTFGRNRDSSTINFLDLNTLIEAGGTAYIPQLDVVVSIHSNRAIIHHPFSEDGTKDSLTSLDLDSSSFRMAMYIVDNRGYYGERYININGMIFKVPCIRRPDMDDGVWVVHPVPGVTGNQSEYRCQHLSMDEAEKLYRLWKTPEDADTYGFSKEALERENLIIKRDQEQRKIDREETKAERDERLSKKKDENTMYKLTREERNERWKQGFDTVKIIASVVGSIALICNAVIKIKSS